MTTEPTLQGNSANTRTIRSYFALIVVTSVLQSGLVLSIYRFRLAGGITWSLALVAISPQFAVIRGALRRRADESSSYISQFYMGAVVFAVVFAVVMFLMTALLVVMTTQFVNSLSFAALVAATPLTLGLLFTVFLMLPKRMFIGGNLGDVLLPVRMKVVTPALRRIFRLTALYLVYLLLDFMAKGFETPTGVFAYAVALLPVLPIFGLIWVYARYMAEEQDEFQRHLFHQSIAWTLLGILIIASALGRLQARALIFRHHPNFFQITSIFPLFWWLQLEAVLIVNAVQAFRVQRQEKRETRIDGAAAR
jgi:hypothetical protein